MKEYQAALHRLTRHVREDVGALADLLNERRCTGQEPALMARDDLRVMIVSGRNMETDR